MKTLIFLFLAVFAISSTVVRADDRIFEVGTSLGYNETTHPAPDSLFLFGSVYLSHTGNLKVIWDGVSVSGGSYGVGTEGDQIHVSARFPSVALDLKKLFGVHWMKAIKTTVNTGGYDDDPVRGSIDSYIGKLMINMTQTLAADKAFTWELTEGAGGAAFAMRHYNVGGLDAKSVPFFFTLDSKATVKLSKSVIVALSIGTYATLMDKQNGPNEDRFGGYFAPSVLFGQKLSTGVRFDGQERLLFKPTGTVHQTSVQTAGFVKYVLSSKKSHLSHSIQLNVGYLSDETLPVEGGATEKVLFTRAQYTVAF